MLKIKSALVMILILLFQILLFSIEVKFYYVKKNNQDPVNPLFHWSYQFLRDIKNLIDPVAVMPGVISSASFINSNPSFIAQIHSKPKVPEKEK